MDDDLRHVLFDPAATRELVLAHRPAPLAPMTCVVSDLVWQDVVRLLRWATAGTGGTAPLDAGRWWRLAAACAELLRRLPGLSDELGEPWRAVEAVDAPDARATARVEAAVDRLAGLLRSTDPLPLGALAVEVDALGAAAIGVLAERSSWTLPDAP
jgi:hypothetical protein